MKQIRFTFGDFKFTFEEKAFLFCVKILFVFLIYYGMFSRFAGFGGLSGGKTAILITGMIFALCCYHFLFLTKQKTVSPLFTYGFIFFVVAGLSPSISAFIYNERLSLIFRFIFEIAIVFIIFFSVYYLIREGIVTPKFFVYTIAITGTIAALQFLVAIFDVVNLRRLRGIGGLNYIGNSFAVSAITYVMILYTGKLKGYKMFAAILGMLFVFLAMLLTGTRAAIISFIAGIFLYQYFGMKSKQFKKYVFIALLIFLIPMTILALNVDLTYFLHRFSYADMEKMAFIRFNIYLSSISDLSLVDFLFGRPDLAAFSEGSLESTEINSIAASSTANHVVHQYLNPHNVFLSLIRFNGIFSFLIFFCLLFIIYSNYFKIYVHNFSIEKFRGTEVTMIIFLTMSLVNVMFSGGKFTRNFYLFIAIGYAIGYLDMLRSVRNPKKYKEKLL